MCINPVEDSEEGISIDEPIFEEESSEPQYPLASLEVS
jgi:hypothetical protein